MLFQTTASSDIFYAALKIILRMPVLLRSHNRLLSTPLDPDTGHSELQKQCISILTCWESPRMEVEPWVEVMAWLICCPTSSSRELGKSMRSTMDGE